MRTPQTLISKITFLFAFISFAALSAPAQTNQPRSLVTRPVNESQMVVLHGNTHPMATADFDRGLAPDSLPMENMQLVLKRSPETQAAIETLLREQGDSSSPNYHKWLTSDEFGARFGATDSDLQTITSWLQSHGFAIINIPAGRGIIQFSGTAGQVRSAFHTSIHSYMVKGEQHWANSSDPQIPAALADAVVGVNTLHDFRKRPLSRVAGTFRRSNATGQVTPLKPHFTFTGSCGTTPCFAVAPFDFATIYNVLPLWNAGVPIDGTGVTIGIVGDSNVNLADITNFRKTFGLPDLTQNQLKIVVPPGATDPGVQKTGDEIEADLDIEWAGAVAKGANIIFAVAKNIPAGANGVDLAAMYLVNLNPAPAVLGESFGLCELGLGTAGNTFFNSMWSQAATEGITVAVSTGDNGATACDIPNINPNKELPADNGLAVSGIASTPFNIAVGGTDFDQLANPAQFWNPTNATTTQASAKGYIPETTWNDSCTNLDYVQFGFSPIPEINCNDVADLAGFINPVGGGGGASSCTNGATQLSQCGGGYAKPAFQVGPGVPNDGKRDIPDVSLFAGDGFTSSFYAICEQDINSPANTPCSASNPNSDIIGVGGTSVSTQAFAGIMALVVQKTGSRQGINAATKMYALAQAQTIAGCNTASPGPSCVFNDVTKGTISQPCLKNSPDCNLSFSSDANGILAGCDAGPGFDLATGLGSFNASNLVNHFDDGAGAGAVDFSLSIANCNSTVMIPSPGGSGSFTVVITELNGFNGAYTFACTGMLTESTCTTATTNIDATHISATVTVSTVAPSSIVPTNRNRPGGGPGLLTIAGALALASFLGAGILLLGFRAKHRRLSTALALVTFAIVVTMAACGGGSGGGGGGGGGNGGTPSGQATPTLTVTSGATIHTLVFTQIVD